MILLVDGYNLLKYINPYRDITEHERMLFLHQLKRYARYKKHKVVVVFDGGPYQWPHKEQVAGIKIIYSGARDTADAVIMHYIADHKTKDLLLITSDHELNLFASKHTIVSIGSDDFYRLFQEGLQEQQEEVQEISVTLDEDELESDLDTLMAQASEMVPCKEEDILPNEVPSRSSRSSKKDRLLLKKLKKL
jgi:predicted RNA-binding protein with PIN domain